MWWWDLEKEVWVETLYKHDIISLKRRSINIRNIKNGFTHNSMLRGWIFVLVYRCGYNFYNINRWNRNCTDRKTWWNSFENFTANINCTFTKMSHRRFTDRMIYRSIDKFIPSTKRRIINETFTNNYRSRFNGRYVRRLLNRFDLKKFEQIYRTKLWYNQKQVYGVTNVLIEEIQRCLMRRLSPICMFYLGDSFFVIHNDFLPKYKYIWLE